MTRSQLEQLDQDYRSLQNEIALEWRLLGETDGYDGADPEYPGNSAYMAGYTPARQHDLNTQSRATLFEVNDKGDRYRGVDPGDAHWLYSQDDDEF